MKTAGVMVMVLLLLLFLTETMVISVRRPLSCAVTHCTVLSLMCPGVFLCAQSRMSDAPSLQTGTVLCSGRYHVQKEINSELTDLKLSLICKLKLRDCLQGEDLPLYIKVSTAYKVGQ
jgi:hypothetical protein